MKNENRGMSKRTVAILLALVLLIGCAVGGTIAWLTDKTQKVTNTFTTSDISIELTETTGAEYKMIPGWTIAKDPKVTVKAGSEACWLFVKIDKSTNFNNYLEYAIADGWTQLKMDKDGNAITDLVYYRQVLATDIGTAYSVLKDDQVTVKTSVTKEQMTALNAEGATKPTLTFTAYACQYYKTNGTPFLANEAWTNANASATPTT